MEEQTESRRGVFASLGGILKTVVAIGENRLELLLVEVEEERWRIFNAMLLAGLVLVLAGMTLMVATIAIVVACLNAGRIDCVVGLAVFYLIVTIISFWLLRRRLKEKAPFAATLGELRKDKACWEEKS